MKYQRSTLDTVHLILPVVGWEILISNPHDSLTRNHNVTNHEKISAASASAGTTLIRHSKKIAHLYTISHLARNGNPSFIEFK